MGEPADIGAEPAGDEEIVRIFHAWKIVQAHLVERPARNQAMDRRDAPALRSHGRQGLGGRLIVPCLRSLSHGPVGHVEGAVERCALAAAARPAAHEEMPVDRRPAQGFVPLPPELHQRVDRAGMEPVGAEIERVAPEPACHCPSADAPARLEDRHAQAGGEEATCCGDSGAACADDHHVRRRSGIGWRFTCRGHGFLHPSLCGWFVHK